MIKMEFSQIVNTIKEHSKLGEEEINQKIKQKMDNLSGLISKEGAAHIVANELGIKIFQTTGKLKIKDMLSGVRNVETAGKVLNVSEVREFQTGERHGKVGNFLMGDESGVIRVVLWQDQADKLLRLKPNDIVRIKGAYIKDNNNRKELHLNDKSLLVVNPPGETIGEVKQLNQRQRRKIAELKEADSDVEILGTIVQIFDLRYFETCPGCGKKPKQKEDGLYCDQHGKIKPIYSYVLNLVLDDGTETIRVVCFRKQLETLIEKKSEEIVSYKDNPAKFEEVKHDLLGQIVKVAGRVNKNEMFDRLEFVSQLVFRNPDPEEELRLLNEEMQKVQQEEIVGIDDV